MTTAELDAAIDEVLDHVDDDPAESLAPYVDALPVSTLFADMAYQRPIDDLRVARMVDEFDVTLLGVLEVSDRGDGTYAILDGHHRCAASREAHPKGADAHLVCQVHRGLTIQAEARVFYEIDIRRKALSGWDRWKARRGAGDPVVLQIERVVNNAGLTVGQAVAESTITATKALETIWTGGGDVLLHNSLTLAKAAWGTANEAFAGVVIQAVAIVLEAYDREELDQDRLIAQMQTIPPRQVQARANALREAHRAEMPRLCAAVLVERYNAGSGKKIEDLLSRAPASTKLLNKTGRRSRQLAAIRRWANRNRMPVAENGRIPRDVVQAYTDAHPGFELAAT